MFHYCIKYVSIMFCLRKLLSRINYPNANSSMLTHPLPFRTCTLVFQIHSHSILFMCNKVRYTRQTQPYHEYHADVWTLGSPKFASSKHITPTGGTFWAIVLRIWISLRRCPPHLVALDCGPFIEQNKRIPQLRPGLQKSYEWFHSEVPLY